jgi:hypothetical protein
MIRTLIIVASLAISFAASAAAQEIIMDGRDGAPIALPAAEDAARMARIRKALHPDDSDGGRVNAGNYGHGIGQGRCVQHPDWRGCGEAHGR